MVNTKDDREASVRWAAAPLSTDKRTEQTNGDDGVFRTALSARLSAAHSPSKRDVGIGCVGAGFIMDECQLVAYRAAGFRPVAIASRSREHAEAVARRHSIPTVHSDYRSLLADPRVEVVDIAVPPDVQIDVVREAVRHSGPYQRHPGAEAARRQLCAGRTDRRLVRRGWHHFGRQPKHALRPIDPGAEKSCLHGANWAHPSWRRSKCERFPIGCLGNSGRGG